jgi:ribosome recycling factor
LANTPDARTIIVQPWDKTAIEPIEKAIKAANLGLNPSNNGERIIVPIPVPTEERRKELVKSAHAEGEHARVSIRNLRHEAMNDIKAMKLPEDSQKDLQGKIEKLTTEWNNKVAALVQGKEVEIMKV